MFVEYMFFGWLNDGLVCNETKTLLMIFSSYFIDETEKYKCKNNIKTR